ncbi:MAG: leucine-rich repeat domain-containing protein, partial [Ureaplasma sp.]|nr:leucine-rich repeat domain-containing protein [Ureaplasma sp.]
PEDFKRYLETHSILDTIYNNLNVENNQTFNKSDILNIEFNDSDQIVVSLKSYEYLKYETEQNNNFIIKNNKLIIDNLDFYYEANVSKDDFIILYYKNVDIEIDGKEFDLKCIRSFTDDAKKVKNIILPKRIDIQEPLDFFVSDCFAFNSYFERIDMSNLSEWAGQLESCEPTFIGKKFTTIPAMFKDDINLKEIILPKNIKTISDLTFLGCNSLETINLPNSLNEIGNNAFELSNLKFLVIPSNVTTLKDTIFKSTSIQWVKISSKIDNISNSAFSGANNSITIYVPTQELKQYYLNKNLQGIKEIIVGEPPAN